MIVQQAVEQVRSDFGLENEGFSAYQNAHWNLNTPALYEHAIRNHEAMLAQLGPLVSFTGKHTGRAAKDKFIVRDSKIESEIWWGSVNRPFDAEQFDRLHRKMVEYLSDRAVYVQDCFAGADPRYRLPIRVVSEMAWHSLFARTMFLQPKPDELSSHRPEFSVIAAPHFFATPDEDGTASPTFILLSFERRMILVGGTEYAGEIKKSIFTVLNYLLPREGVLPMHCSANYGTDKNDAALFFGLSGTGKTTLSSDPARTLIGDDEHGWSDNGVFNFEGGCYAKVIRLSRDGEPEIYEKTRRFGTILENVVVDGATGALNLDDQRFTENTRAAYSIHTISNADPTGICGHPKNVIFLTADAFGVLPPVARLTNEQAMYHFISGYTAKIAGTEAGVGSEPQATFSACFGAPFLPLHPKVYAGLLSEKLRENDAKVWLVNTGWTAGPYGEGHRMSLAHTRAIISAILNGELQEVATAQDPIFGLHIPIAVPGVPAEALTPRDTWADKAAYDRKAQELAHRFKNNFATYADQVAPEVVAAGPRI
jgi:phosphoenolpyruvate carboxykinase (ATP)